MTMKALLPLADVKKAKPASGADLVMIGSTGALDRDGDIIQQRFDLKAYRKNPVVLWGHRMGDLPIGKAVKVGVVGAGDAKHLEAHWAFVPEDIYPFAGIVRRLYEEKFLNASSIGFRPLETKEHEAETKEELVGAAAWFGMTITKAELLEHSAVSVPANAEALQAAVDGKHISADEANILAGVAGMKGIHLTALMRKELTDSGRVREALAAIGMTKDGASCDGDGCVCPTGGTHQKDATGLEGATTMTDGGIIVVRTEINAEAVKAAAAEDAPIRIEFEVDATAAHEAAEAIKAEGTAVLDAIRQSAQATTLAITEAMGEEEDDATTEGGDNEGNPADTDGEQDESEDDGDDEADAGADHGDDDGDGEEELSDEDFDEEDEAILSELLEGSEDETATA